MGVVTYIGPGTSILVTLSTGGQQSVRSGVATTLDDATCAGLLFGEVGWWQADDPHTAGLVPTHTDWIVNVTSAITLQGNNSIVFGDATAGSFNVYLPDGTTMRGKEYTIVNTGSVNNVVIQPVIAGQTINGSPTFSLAPGFAVVVISDGSTTWRWVAEWPSGGGGGNAVTEVQQTGGSLGSTATINFGSVTNEFVQLTGTLTANCTITFSNRAAGCSARLLLAQDATGGRTLTVSDGTNSSAVAIPSSANAVVLVDVECPNSTDIYVSTEGGGGGFTNPMTTSQDLVVGGSSGVPSRLGVGSNGQVLTVAAGAVGWAAPSGGASGDPPTIVSPGNLGANYTLALSAQQTWLFGTLNANCALTISGLLGGYWGRLFLTQDATGNRTLTVNGTSVPLTITATTTSEFVFAYDGVNLYMVPD